ncbi:MAG: amino acid permease [Anaerolineae bacterium]|nr:amino acid permease [Anaerolineae bacterium]
MATFTMGEEKKGALLRELGVKEGLAIGLGTMIGAGIFVLSTVAAERVGRAAALSYLLTGMICLPVAMVISELATGMPRAGGSYTFITQALGPLAGSVVGPANWLGLTFANGFYLVATGQYLALFLPVPPWAGAAATGLLFTWLNYRGAKISGSVQYVVVLLLIAILTLFVAVGIPQTAPISADSFASHGWGAVVSVIGLIIVSFTGFEKVSTISEEIKNPDRNLPRAIIGSVAIATFIYALLLLVATGLVSSAETDPQKGLLVEAASRAAGPVGETVMMAAALLATLSSANAATMASSRISYGMGRDRTLPGWFNYTHQKFSTPSHAILVAGGLGTLLAMTGQAATLAEISSAMFLVSYTLLCISVIVMRRAKPSWYRPAFRAPLYPALPIVAGLVCLSVILTMETLSQIAGVGLVVLSLLWYVVWVRKQAVVTGEIGPLWERERPLEGMIEAAEAAVLGGKNEITIPLLEDSEPASLLELATALALADEQAVINVLDIKAVPMQTPLELAQGWLEQRQGPQEYMLAQMAAQAAMRGVPVRTLRRAAHDLASGILAVVESRPATGLVLTSWHKVLAASQVSDSIVKRILEGAHCNVAVLRARGLKQIKRVLAPIGGGPHARLGLHLASQIAHGDQATLTVLRILRPRRDLDVETEIRGLRHVIADILGETASDAMACVRVHEGVVDGILQEAREGEYDLLVIGASEEWTLKNLLAGAVPDAVANRAPCSVLMVRRYEPSGVSTTRRIMSSLRGWK